MDLEVCMNLLHTFAHLNHQFTHSYQWTTEPESRAKEADKEILKLSFEVCFQQQQQKNVGMINNTVL